MYKSLKQSAVFETEILRSRFLGFCKPIDGEQDALNFLSGLRAEYKDATHVCYAYIADDKGNVIRFSDDGEPQGTAGIPILETIKNKNLRCAVVAVVRYFGGIKLGAGGLVRAYAKCAANAIEKAGVCIYEKALKLGLTCGYQQFKILENCINRFDGEILDRVYENDIKVLFVLKKDDVEDFQQKLKDAFNNEISADIMEETYYNFE